MSCRRQVTALAAVAVLPLAACVGEDPAAPEAGPLGSAIGVETESPPLGDCVQGVQPSGSLYEICFPESWNGSLAVWAHGYKSPFEPLEVPDDEIEGTPLRDIVRDLGFAYAATSYRRNGLVAADAADDLEELVGIFGSRFGAPVHVFGTGASEGALAMALALERAETGFDGGLIVCGPVGSFRRQIEHFGDVRVLFDYFFPGVLPGSPVSIPSELQDDWSTVYEPKIRRVLAVRPLRTAQLVNVTKIAVDPENPATAVESILAALWYNAFATNDAVSVLGGNPFDNAERVYRGSLNDARLNVEVERIAADAAALAAMEAYETSGDLTRPTQSLHTLLDPVVPFWHQPEYREKAAAAGAGGLLVSVPTPDYGHCAVSREAALASFALLVLRVTGSELAVPASVFADEAEADSFLRLAREAGASPRVVGVGPGR